MEKMKLRNINRAASYVSPFINRGFLANETADWRWLDHVLRMGICYITNSVNHMSSPKGHKTPIADAESSPEYPAVSTYDERSKSHSSGRITEGSQGWDRFFQTSQCGVPKNGGMAQKMGSPENAFFCSWKWSVSRKSSESFLSSRACWLPLQEMRFL